MVLTTTKRQLLPLLPMGAMQEVGLHRGLRVNNGISRGVGMGIFCGKGVGDSAMALNLQAERLRAVGHDQLTTMEGAAFTDWVMAITWLGSTRLA